MRETGGVRSRLRATTMTISYNYLPKFSSWQWTREIILRWKGSIYQQVRECVRCEGKQCKELSPHDALRVRESKGASPHDAHTHPHQRRPFPRGAERASGRPVLSTSSPLFLRLWSSY